MFDSSLTVANQQHNDVRSHRIGYAWHGMSVPTHLACGVECPELTVVSVTIVATVTITSFVTGRRDIVIEVISLTVHHHNVR